MGKDISDRRAPPGLPYDVSNHYDLRMKKMLIKNIIRGKMCEDCTEQYYSYDATEKLDDDLPSGNCYRFIHKPIHETCPWFNIPMIKKNG